MFKIVHSSLITTIRFMLCCWYVKIYLKLQISERAENVSSMSIGTCIHSDGGCVGARTLPVALGTAATGSSRSEVSAKLRWSFQFSQNSGLLLGHSPCWKLQLTLSHLQNNLLQHYAKLAFKRSEFIWNWDTCLQCYSQIGREVVFSKDP